MSYFKAKYPAQGVEHLRQEIVGVLGVSSRISAR
jgi:hypothetical protein